MVRWGGSASFLCFVFCFSFIIDGGLCFSFCYFFCFLRVGGWWCWLLGLGWSYCFALVWFWCVFLDCCGFGVVCWFACVFFVVSGSEVVKTKSKVCQSVFEG